MKTKTKTKQLVTKSMLIGEVINKHPETASVMLSYGLHCIGCSANPFDTIESGCLIHGMSEETIDKLVDDVNAAIEKSKDRKDKVVSITKVAAGKFKEFMREEHKEGYGIRLSAFGGGCSGLQYGLDFADKPTKSEDVFEDNGIKVFVDENIVGMIKGTNIDFVENEKGSGFKIDNPNANTTAGGCGCAE